MIENGFSWSPAAFQAAHSVRSNLSPAPAIFPVITPVISAAPLFTVPDSTYESTHLPMASSFRSAPCPAGAFTGALALGGGGDARQPSSLSDLFSPMPSSAPLPSALPSALASPLRECASFSASSALHASASNAAVDDHDRKPNARAVRELAHQKNVRCRPLMPATANCIQGPIAWVSRADNSEIIQLAFLPDNHPDAVEVIERRLADGNQFKGQKSACMALIDAAKLNPNDDPKDVWLRDSLFLMAKAGTPRQTLVAEVTRRSGALGAKIFTNLLAISETASDAFDADSGQLTRDMLLDLQGWQQAYHDTVLRQLNVDAIVAQAASEVSLADQAVFKNSHEKINQQFEQWAQSGWVKRSPWLMRKLNHRMVNAVLQSVCARRYASDTAGWLPGLDQARLLAKRLRAVSENSELHAVAQALDKGWIQVQVLDNMPFMAARFDLRLELPRAVSYGFALGPQIFVRLSAPASVGEAGTRIDPRDQGTMSVLLHEGVHALDWLRAPTLFEDAKQGRIDATYSIERHAFLVQRRYLQDAMRQQPMLHEGEQRAFPLALASLASLRGDIMALYGCPVLEAFDTRSGLN